MTHPLLRKDIFVETAFEKRFQAMLRWAWHKRSWHVVVADPGAGKTMGIRDLPDPTWLQFRRRFDKLEPFCRIASHSSEEVRDILATLEKVYQWAGTIYTWLTHPVLDPTHSGRVTMDNLMKLVTTALEWTYEAKAPDVVPSWLKSTAEPLVLRHDTLKIIDGAGPGVEVPPSESTEQGNGSGTEPEREAVQSNVQQHTTETTGTVGELVQTGKTAKCTFPGVVSIDLQRFLASFVTLVECPRCARTPSLAPSKGLLRFRLTTNAKRMPP